ncbi:MAG: argininosuccinate synthase domain-containing protein [Bacteroidota bacterium]
MQNKKLVLAFSGGLDTTYCALYLNRVQGFDVHALTIDTGGFSKADLQQIEERAKSLGVASYKVIDASRSYYDKVIRYLLYGNVLKNDTYPLSVSAERVAQAAVLAKYVKESGAEYVAHGSTGAGNDQVRFDMILQNLVPGIKIITPIRDLKLSREDEIVFLKQNGVEMNFEKAKYSINQGLWGTSVGGRETLSSKLPLPEEAWPTQVSQTETRDITLKFEKGDLVSVDNTDYEHPAQAIQALAAIAQPYGIGRDIHVGDTILGIKGRVGFEAAAPLIAIKAHHTLEKHVLGKWQLYWKDQVSTFYGNHLHEGMYLDPVMRDFEAMLLSSQRNVSGSVFVRLNAYRFDILGSESEHDLMSDKFGTYGEMNRAWTGEDVKGFIKIFGNQNSIYYHINPEQNPFDE